VNSRFRVVGDGGTESRYTADIVDRSWGLVTSRYEIQFDFQCKLELSRLPLNQV
jgi:hypothetical protein